MVPNITVIRQRLTGEWASLRQPEAMLAACGEVGYPGWRDRVLTPVTTVQRFLWQILHGNTACSHLPHLSKEWHSRTTIGAHGNAPCVPRFRVPCTPRSLTLKGTLMEPCRTCGAPIPETLIDDYCAPCLDALPAELAETLLRGFLADRWVNARQHRRRHPWGNPRRWQRSA